MKNPNEPAKPRIDKSAINGLRPLVSITRPLPKHREPIVRINIQEEPEKQDNTNENIEEIKPEDNKT